MKLEVGKKYVKQNGDVTKLIAKHDDRGVYVSYSRGKNWTCYDEYDENGLSLSNQESENLVSEYVEPETRDAWVAWYEAHTFEIIFSQEGLKEAKEDGAVSIEKVTLTKGVFNVD